MMMISREIPKSLEKNVLQCQFVCHRSHLGSHLGVCGERPVSDHLRYHVVVDDDDSYSGNNNFVYYMTTVASNQNIDLWYLILLPLLTSLACRPIN
jgi:hypothetical protein